MSAALTASIAAVIWAIWVVWALGPSAMVKPSAAIVMSQWRQRKDRVERDLGDCQGAARSKKCYGIQRERERERERER